MPFRTIDGVLPLPLLRRIRVLGTVAVVASLVLVLAVGQGSKKGASNFYAPDVPRLPAALTITPAVGSAHVQDLMTLTVRVADATNRPVGGEAVSLQIVGTNSGVRGLCAPSDCRTDPRGLLTFRYEGESAGQDEVSADIPGFPVAGTSALEWSPSVRGSSLAVLGDSYSAGEGASDYLPATDISGVNLCHRSPLSYGTLIDADDRFPTMAFRACSGAVTDDLFRANSGGNKLSDGTIEPAQLCVECTDTLPAAVGPDTQAVTLTIGGNDVGFSEVLSACLWVSELHLNYGRPGRGCSGQSSIVDPVADRLAALAGRDGVQAVAPNGRPVHPIGQILAQIHAQAPVAHVYVLGYPQLFQPASGDCFVGRIDVGYAGRSLSVATKVTPGDARWMDSVAEDLDDVDRNAVAAAGAWASFVDVAAAFDGHGLCTDSTLINGISGTLTFKNTHDVQTAIAAGSFHPTDMGQAEYASMLERAGL